MGKIAPVGWKSLLSGYPWFLGKGRYPVPAYSEFMPPPRVGRSPYGYLDVSQFHKDDLFGWYVSEVEEEFELQPGLANLANQIVKQIVELGQGKPAYAIAGQNGRNLADNPYWPPELAVMAGKLQNERFVVFLPLALSKTQDDKGRIRWTFFGSSEQGPERAFWQSFYFSPTEEIPAPQALSFLFSLLSGTYHETCRDISDLDKIGFRILPAPVDSRFPYWADLALPSYIKPFLLRDDKSLNNVRYLLTFTPFSLLSAEVRKRYLDGQLVILPFPGSLVFWGMKNYIGLQNELPLAMQLPLQRLAARHGGPHGIRIPQSGRFHESGSDLKLPDVADNLLLNTYKRTSRWDRVHRHENEIVVSTIEDTIGRVLFSTNLDVMGLYGKPMARNCQLWTGEGHLLLDGPKAGHGELEKAATIIARGGTFRYRFLFPAMQVGLNEIYWHRPLTAYWDSLTNEIKTLRDSPLGYLTAYHSNQFDIVHPVVLWPRVQRREVYLTALRNFENLEEHYQHQTVLNIIRLLDVSNIWTRQKLPGSFARQMLHLQEHETLKSWLIALLSKAQNSEEVQNLSTTLANYLEVSPTRQNSLNYSSQRLETITYHHTTTRQFEKNWWHDIQRLALSKYLNKDNADCVDDVATRNNLIHHHRDLEKLGDFLLRRHRKAISNANMEGKAFCGEIPFHWETDFDFSSFGGWKNNQESKTHERNLLVVIPGKNRREAIIMADHYDTAYMEDVYNKSSGGTGARIAAPGADDNCSATATLLQAASIFLRLSKDGRLERDVWLIHLTGEEFPSDCMGARHLAQMLIEKTLWIRLINRRKLDLSDVQIAGIYIMDMIGHNRDTEKYIFQISPGKNYLSLRLALQAHLANNLWNVNSIKWNEKPIRRGKGRGTRSSSDEIPSIAEFPQLSGEIRLTEDPRSTLFNTDGQIFSDCGIPVVLFMENYDIKRAGYHDTKDNMRDIDLDYGAAMAAIVIETVARAAVLRQI